MQTKTSREIRIKRYQRKIRKLLDIATPGQIVAACQWYEDAQAVAQIVADNMNTSLEVGAAIVSAYSPNCRWSHNVSLAIRHSLGQTTRALPIAMKTAKLAEIEGFAALNGPKTNAFARAIAGDETAVVVDIWICRAVQLTKKNGDQLDSPTIRQYREISQAIVRESRRIGLCPRDAQALAWVVVRGSAT